MDAKGYDGYILVAENVEKVFEKPISGLEKFHEPLRTQHEIDNSVNKEGVCLKVDGPINRLFFAPTGPLNRDYDDVRRFHDAGENGIKKALKAGFKSPLLIVLDSGKFENEKLVALLGALHALYVPIEVSEIHN